MSTLGSEIIYEDTLPLTWRVEQPGSKTTHTVFNDPNLEFLHILFALEDHKTEIKAETRDDHTLEIWHLDAKLNLLLEMMGRLLIKHSSLPPFLPVRLNHIGIQWSIPERTSRDHENPGHIPAPPPVNESVLIEIYLRPDYPLPIVLPARIDSVVNEPGATRISSTFYDIILPVQDLLERAIFRRHRRMIALTRGSIT